MCSDELGVMEPAPEEKPVDSAVPVVMVAGPFGSGMEELAATLAEKLKVPLYDPHKLEELASRRGEHEGAWHRLKEGVGSFFEYWVGRIHRRPGVSQDEHRVHLKDVLRGVSAGGGVMVGVCTHAVVPGEHVFRIYVGASPGYCARRLAEMRQCEAKEALAVFYRMEEEHNRFLRDILEDLAVEDIPYDLILNADVVTPQRMLEECLAAMSARQFFAKAA